MTLAGPSAVYRRSRSRTMAAARAASTEVTHLVHAPSNPPGWSAGKWGEWYPDILDADGKLTTAHPKPYWQTGWLAQHDRLMASLAAMKGRAPLVISGDLHAIGMGRMLRCGTLDLRATRSRPCCRVRSARPRRLSVVGPRRRRQPPAHLDTPGTSADRAARIHDRRLPAGSDHPAVLQMGPEDAASRGDRHAGAVPYPRARAAGLTSAPGAISAYGLTRRPCPAETI